MTFVYTALGDSLTVGKGDFFRAGFVTHYANLIEKSIHQKVSLNIQAQSGITSSQFIQKLQNRETRRAIAEADFITITLGGNDLLQALRFHDLHMVEKSLKLFSQNMNFILKEIHNIKSYVRKRHCSIQLIGLYNPVPQLPYSHFIIQRYNQALHAFTSTHVSYVDVYNAFRQQPANLLATDGHPNHLGHKLIAETAYRSALT